MLSSVRLWGSSMEDSKSVFQLSRALNLGLVVALCWLPFELSRIGAHGDLAWVSFFLFWGLGVSVGLVIEVEAWTVRRHGLQGLAAALVFALGGFLITVPLASTLFDGSFASTLPGAKTAPIWFPLVAFATLALGLWPFLAFAKQSTGGRARLFVLGVALVVVAAGVEWANRTVRPSEYPDVHSFCVCVVFIASYLALGRFAALFASETPAPSARGRWSRVLPWLYIPLLVTSLISSALLGLQEREDRVRLARDGQHSKWLVRSLRRGIDLDRDGYSSVFGGADCDDLDPARHPDAMEIAGNEIDENCDGLSSARAVGLGPQAEVRSLAFHPDELETARAAAQAWRASQDVREFIDQLDRPHLVLISVDALRADLLRESVANRAEFPNLFALLDESRRFEHAFSPAAGTDLSMSTLMTGHIDAFAPTPSTLAETLSAAGWYTTSVVPREVLRYAGKTLLMRGFLRTTRLVNDAQERDVGMYSSSWRATELALGDVDRYLSATAVEAELSDAQHRPLALWVHYFDVHEHDELSPYDRRLRQRTRSKDPVERYRASLALVDEAVGELRRGLEERGLWSRSVVVLVSDHGESLGEDPRLPDNHGLVLYAPLTDIPFAIRVPGVSGSAVAMPASLLDLAPTLTSLLGLPATTGADGLDLLPELTPASLKKPNDWDELRSRAIPLYESEQRGVVSWPYKLLWRPEDRVYELFDLEADPAEANDLSESEDELRAQLAWLLSEQPRVVLDRTPSGRRARDKAAKNSHDVGN